MKHACKILQLALVLTSSFLAVAQTNPNLEIGIKPYGSYDASKLDTVSLTNRNLTVTIPVVSNPQRGSLTGNTYIVYNNKAWRVLETCNLGVCSSKWLPRTAPAGQVQSGLQLISDAGFLTSPPAVDGYNAFIFSVADWRGTSHIMGRGNSDPGRSLIGGTTSDVSGCSGPRTVTSASIAYRPGPLVNGVQTTAQIKACVASVPLNTAFGARDENAQPITEYHSASSGLIQSFILYDGNSWSTSPQWIFRYDDNADGTNYGDPTEIILPTGGHISYTWETINWFDTVCAGMSGPSHTPASRAVVTRSEDANDGNGPQVWNYKAAASNQSPFVGASFIGVSDPRGNEVVHTFWPQGTSGCYLYEVYTQYYQGMQSPQNLLKSVRTDYRYTNTTMVDGEGHGIVAAILPSVITTTLPNNRVSQIQRDYVETDGVTGTVQVHDYLHNNYYNLPLNLIEQREYDYGVGAPPSVPTKRTHYKYVFEGSNQYLMRNILDRVSSVTVYDGSSTQVAKTTYGFDEYALTSSGVSSTYLDTTIGSYRGNTTSVSKWVIGSTNLVSTTTYYDSGMPYRATDPGGHTTTFAYSPTYIGAYVTQTQMPTTGTVQHVISGQYDFNTGAVTSFTDQNAQSSSYSYDYLARITGASFPDGGTATFNYPDLVTVERKRKIDSRFSDEFVQFDGLGRQSRRATFNDQSPAYDQADTCYWGDGTVKFKAYPYQGNGLSGSTRVCSGAGDTYGYDGLQRVLSITHADGSQITNQYTNSGGQNTAAVLTTDEGNGTTTVSRESQSDGLGRLVSVCEVSSTTLLGVGATPAACNQDIGKTGFLTTYGYDALGNLTSVNLNGSLSRSFIYDGLSRLTSATNPESGTVTYAYTADSLLLTRKRPLPNQTNPANLETTTYSYDELHRQRTVSYSDGVTPTATFNYDEATVAGQSTVYPVGHLTSETTSNTGSYFWNFDSMGRPKGMSQCTPQTCPASYYNTTYTYDALGDLATMALPLNLFSLTYTYNAGARLGSISSSLNDPNHPGLLLSGITYGPFGIVSRQFGNLAVEEKTYSARGWQSGSSDFLASGEYEIAPPTSGAATISIGGSERSTQQLISGATHSTGTVTISGAEQRVQGTDCPPGPPCYIYDNGTVTITLMGTPFQVTYDQGSTATLIASALVSKINGNSTFLNTFIVSNSGGVISFTSRATGSGTNYPLTTTYTWDRADFRNPSFTSVASGMSGGRDAQYQTVYDTGNLTITVNGFPETVSYGQTSTTTGLASALASAFHNAGSSPVDATSSGSTLTVTARATGESTNYPLITASATNSSSFTGTSFPITAPGTLTGGADAQYSYHGPPLYAFTIPSFAPDGNILQSTDTVNGNWTYTYDEFNRLKTGVASSIGEGCSWDYDRWGNRWHQNAYNGTCLTPNFPSSGGNNRIDGASYDATGNLLTDPSTGMIYGYDAENRLISAGSYSYVYDAEGRRVAKEVSGSITNQYLLDAGGAQLIELDGIGNVLHTNIFANGSLVATYMYNLLQQSLTYFHFSDWLGNRRYQVNAAGPPPAETCTNLPFGDNLSCAGDVDATEHHFTGKERDTESGLDDFGARYNASGLGRFMSPDDFGGHLEDPQTLNKYAYVGNSPLRYTDPSGHDFWQSCYDRSSTCGNQVIGKDTNGKDINQLVSGTTDSSGTFTATIITSASLGQAGSGNTGLVNGDGVQIITGTGTDKQQSGQGIFIAGTASADIKGRGTGWGQFNFHIDGNDVAHGALTSGTAIYVGSGGHQGMVNAINSMASGDNIGPFQYPGEDHYNPFHPGATNARFSPGDYPEILNYGPSPHFPVPGSGTSVPNFHVDNATGVGHAICAKFGALCY